MLAWDYGPVVRSVYENYKKHDSSIISVKKELKSEDISATSDLSSFLTEIMELSCFL
ncbi:MAG: hypothetical protein LE169_05955 [Endomicrobium sp.]|nr:hypothetical protein [Endomicrobium sp.]